MCVNSWVWVDMPFFSLIQWVHTFFCVRFIIAPVQVDVSTTSWETIYGTADLFFGQVCTYHASKDGSMRSSILPQHGKWKVNTLLLLKSQHMFVQFIKWISPNMFWKIQSVLVGSILIQLLYQFLFKFINTVL